MSTIPASIRTESVTSAPASERRRVTLVIANFGWGGAQKIMAMMANYWAVRGWHVTYMSLDEQRCEAFFPIDDRVDLVALGVRRHTKSVLQAVWQNVRRLIVLRRAIRASRPDVVISFLSVTNMRVLMATIGLGLPVIVSERGDPRRRSISAIWRHLRSVLYPLARSLVAQTDYARDCFHSRIRKRSVVIPNPVVLPDQPVPRTEKIVVGVGHLAPVKGFDILVRAFGQVAKAHPDWRLILWGQGDERERLTTMAADLGIADRLDLPGLSDRPGAWADNASIFVLASRHEGFPNTLIEAMAAGLPVIATDCPIGGPRVMIDHDETGLLVPSEDETAMAAALNQLIAEETARDRLAAAARRHAETFALDRIMGRWTDLVHQAATRAVRS
ncbi:MAG: glycosyltransferase family 4 protein [Geminicoccaceae bacterium]